MPSSEKSLKRFVLIWLFILGLCLFGLLSYQSTRSFLKAIDFSTQKRLYEFRNELQAPAGSKDLGNGYHIASSWEHVPESIKERFQYPPTLLNRQQRIFEDWIYFAPPGKSFRVMLSESDVGEKRYLSSVIYFSDKKKDIFEKHKDSIFIDPMVEIALWGVLALIIFMVAVYLILRAIVQPVYKLQGWAKRQNSHTIDRDVPDFQFTELNELAHLYHQGMTDLAKTTASEKEFLQFASHELRTPLTVLHSNISLLAKLEPDDIKKNEEVRARIYRASQSMKGITETLLWLYRGDNIDSNTITVNIAQLLKETADNLQYLLVGKNIKLHIDAQESNEAIPLEAFSILLNNLIRNAFQHTEAGEIKVSFAERKLCISNPLAANSMGQQGFGLGLKLVNALAEKFGWGLDYQQDGTSFKVILSL